MSPSTRMPSIAARGKPTCMGSVDGDDLDDAGLDEAGDPLADRGLREPDGASDGRVGAAAVLLELLDDGLGGVIERHWPRAW